MSEKHDKLSQIRLDPVNDRKLRLLQKKLPIKATLGALANTAIFRGIQAIEAGLPAMKEIGK
jgi:hypothetical protein